MRRSRLVAWVVGTAGLLVLTACSGSGGPVLLRADAAGTEVGVILPDSMSSPRWENEDRPLLHEAFTSAGMTVDIQNAGADPAKYQTIADGMIEAGVKVLVIANLDSFGGSLVIDKAEAVGIPVIDYDRLTVGGGAQYYVSFDNEEVGRVIGKGLVKCLQDAGTTSGGVIGVDGSTTDSNAALFKRGYDKVVEEAGYDLIADQAVPDWDPVTGGTLFSRMATQHKGDYVGVAAANDGLAGAVISKLADQGLAGTIPVTGQDASPEGLQRVLLGTQCVTVQKSVRQEAYATADLAAKLVKGDTAGADASATGSVSDNKLKTKVRSILLVPRPIYRDNVVDTINDGSQTKAELCTTEKLKKACAKYKVS